MKDGGSILPLVAGLLSVCGVFAVGVVDATDLAIARAELHTIADGAALAAAQSVTPTNARVTGGRLAITLTAASVKHDAQLFISDSRTPGVSTAIVVDAGRSHRRCHRLPRVAGAP